MMFPFLRGRATGNPGAVEQFHGESFCFDVQEFGGDVMNHAIQGFIHGLFNHPLDFAFSTLQRFLQEGAKVVKLGVLLRCTPCFPDSSV